jgi:hypothetical protein
MAAKRDQWVGELAERAERSIAGPRPNIYNMVDPVQYYGGVKARTPKHGNVRE